MSRHGTHNHSHTLTHLQLGERCDGGRQAIAIGPWLLQHQRRECRHLANVWRQGPQAGEGQVAQLRRQAGQPLQAGCGVWGGVVTS